MNFLFVSGLSHKLDACTNAFKIKNGLTNDKISKAVIDEIEGFQFNKQCIVSCIVHSANAHTGEFTEYMAIYYKSDICLRYHYSVSVMNVKPTSSAPEIQSDMENMLNNLSEFESVML